MTEQQALQKMISPSTNRPSKYGSDRGFGGVIQIHLTRACDKSCYSCTQGSNLGGKTHFMSVEHFRQAVESLKGYRGIIGVFGGNPATHPQFIDICAVLREMVPFNRRGLWCNNPITIEKAQEMSRTFDPSVSNLNTHLDTKAYQMFRRGWPTSRPFGHNEDSRHSPPYVAMKDVLKKDCPVDDGLGTHDGCKVCNGTGQVYDESRAWELISNCDINKGWSALVGVFRGELRAWFCEIAGAQSILHQDEPDYPDTGLRINDKGAVVLDSDFGPTTVVKPLSIPSLEGKLNNFVRWWELPMSAFGHQVRKHCHDCGVPLRGHGQLAQGSEEQLEQVSVTHQSIYKTKRKDRRIELVTVESQLGERLGKVTDYMGNARRN